MRRDNLAVLDLCDQLGQRSSLASVDGAGHPGNFAVLPAGIGPDTPLTVTTGLDSASLGVSFLFEDRKITQRLPNPMSH